MNLEPADVDRFIQTVSRGIADGIIHIVEIIYRWQRNRTAPYYLPPPQEQEAQPKEEPTHNATHEE